MAVELNPAQLGVVAAGVGVPIAFMLLRKLPTLQVEKGQLERSFSPALAARYAKWEAASLVPLFIFTAMFTYAFYKAFLAIAVYATTHQDGSEYYYLPDIFWFLPAFFLAIIASAIPLHYLYSSLLDKDYNEYTLYCNIKAGFDAWKVLKFLGAVIVLVCAATFPFALDTYLRTDTETIAVNPFLSLGEQAYSYQEIAELRKIASFRAPNGNIVYRTFYEVEFQDGYLWSSRKTLIEMDEHEKRNFINLLSTRSGLEVVEYKFK